MTGTKHRTGAARPNLFFIFSVTVAGILSNSVLSPNIPSILEDLGQPASRAGLLVAAGPLPGVLMAPIVGVLADRYGRRQILVPCLVLFGVAALLAAAAPTFSLLLIARFLQGVGGAGLINLAIVLISDHWDGLERTKLIGRNSAVLTVCLAIVPSIGGVIGELVSWRLALALGAVALPLGFVGWRTLPSTRPGADRTVGEQLRGAALVLRQPAILAILLAGVLLFTVIFGVFLTALPVHLEQQFNLGPGLLGIVLSTFAVGASISAFNLGVIKGRIGARPLLVASSCLIAVAAVGIGVAPSVWLIVVACIIYGFGDGAAIPALQDMIASAAPDDQRASVMAAWVAGVRLGQTIGPLGAAALFAVTSTQTTMLVGAGLFAALAVLMAVAPINPDEA